MQHKFWVAEIESDMSSDDSKEVIYSCYLAAFCVENSDLVKCLIYLYYLGLSD